MSTPGPRRAAREQNWRFLTNHGVVLLFIDETPSATVAEIADRVGISHRSAQMIVSDLAEAGYVVRERVGRNNRYSVNRDLPMRHPAIRDRARVDSLLNLLRR